VLLLALMVMAAVSGYHCCSCGHAWALVLVMQLTLLLARTAAAACQPLLLG
jgi:hypothetical protein